MNIEIKVTGSPNEEGMIEFARALYGALKADPSDVTPVAPEPDPEPEPAKPATKRRGRPKGSTNKKKAEVKVEVSENGKAPELADVSAALQKFLETNETKKALALLQKYDANTVKELRPETYAPLLADLTAS